MIYAHYKEIQNTIGPHTRLCVVSKNRTREEILSYYDAGERIFGENRVQELLTKVNLPKDIQWHFIGHLQRNKVRDILPFVSCIQSLDRETLADTLEKEAARIARKIDVLCEFHLALQDHNKTGHDPEDAVPFVSYCMQKEHLNVQGIMVIGPHTNDQKAIAEVFQQAQDLFHLLQDTFGKEHIQVLSMGMSHDYKLAVQYGSTMVRIGTYLFQEEEL